MTETETTGRRPWEYAPLDPTALRHLSRHASDVLSRAGIGPDRTPLGEAGAHLSAALSALSAVLTPREDADDADLLSDVEYALTHLHRTAGHLREHAAQIVSEEERETRHRGMVESCRREGLTVIEALTAELTFGPGRRVTVRLEATDAYQHVRIEEEGQPVRTWRLSGRDRLELHSGLHELGRIVWLRLRAEEGLPC
ncbi:hypothetical protein [Kitasatospora griseola]|uniref:hypothetical protein n=1 Tax=Kitasatospora griseola TaxID=2064 RepID=UPI00382BFAB0